MTLFPKDQSIAHGVAVVIFDRDKGFWVLPGGRKVYTAQEAHRHAVRMNALMQAGEKMRGTGISRVCP